MFTLNRPILAARTARAAEQQIDALRRREYPDAFRRGEAQTHRLQIESLAGEVVKKVKWFRLPQSPRPLTMAQGRV